LLESSCDPISPSAMSGLKTDSSCEPDRSKEKIPTVSGFENGAV
jgi:hypothetical protein